jgi:hypothetical protein
VVSAPEPQPGGVTPPELADPRVAEHGVTAPQPQQGGLTALELFFDLVFVFTITQLTTVLEGRPKSLNDIDSRPSRPVN